MAAIPIATLEAAPWREPSFMIWLVPMPWATVPIPSPRANGSVILDMVRISGPNTAPMIPAPMTKATAIAGFPPMMLAASIATGVVTALTAEAAWILSERSNIFASHTAEQMVAIVPAHSPIIAALYFSISIFLFLYNGNASATVAGPNKKVIHSFACV